MEKKILVADDSSTARNIIASLLRDKGYSVTEAVDGLDAINKAYQIYPDLILLDIFMPKINGHQVCRMLKNDELTKSIPLIMLTSAATKENRFWSLRTGADGFVAKEGKPLDDLAAMVEGMLLKALPKGFSKEQISKTVPADPVEIFSKIAGLLDKELYTATVDKIKLEIILQGITEGLFTIDAAGIITSFNPAMEHMSGIAKEAAMGKKSGELFKDSLCGGDCIFTQIAELKTDIVDRDTLLNKACTKSHTPVLLSVSLIKGDRDKIEGAICVVKDITKMKAVERMKEDFVSMVTHELRNPLGVIREAAKLVADLGPLNQQQHKFRTMLENSASRLLGLVNNLLDISKMESDAIKLHKESVDMCSVAKKSMSQMELIAKNKKIPISFEGPDGGVFVLADANRVEQIYVNLLSNAIKYTPENGAITVQVKDLGDHMESVVSDTGSGIPADSLEKIFDKYQQIYASITHQASGTGLGLAVVKSIVEAHGGAIRVESELEKGSKFVFTIPKNSVPA